MIALTVEDREALFRDLRQAEGFRAHPYRDTEGYLTIGYGTNLDAGISRRQAQALADVKLDDDVLPALSARLPWVADLDSVRKRAFVELAYNMGLGNRQRGLLSFRNTLAAAERGDWETAAAGLLKSRWAKQVKVTRANRIAKMVRTGIERTHEKRTARRRRLSRRVVDRPDRLRVVSRLRHRERRRRNVAG